MTPDELQARFTAEIEKRAVFDRYIDGQEERELMQIGIQHGYDTQAARDFLVEVCTQRGYIIEAAVVTRIREQLRTAVRGDGLLDRQGYERVVKDARDAVNGTTRTESDVRRLVLITLNDAGSPQVKTGWFGNWFAKAKRHVGV
ncbi:hypothetical protein BH11PLA2_BH11PLA2_39210 [soil metagenome]